MQSVSYQTPLFLFVNWYGLAVLFQYLLTVLFGVHLYSLSPSFSINKWDGDWFCLAHVVVAGVRSDHGGKELWHLWNTGSVSCHYYGLTLWSDQPSWFALDCVVLTRKVAYPETSLSSVKASTTSFSLSCLLHLRCFSSFLLCWKPVQIWGL